MGWLTRLFGFGDGSDEGDAKQSTTKRKGVMVYDPNLIEKLKAQHKSLVDEFLKIEKLLDAGDPKATARQIKKFSQELHKHLIIEDHKFYKYINYELANDPKSCATALRFDEEMKAIGTVIKDFVDKRTSESLWTESAISEIKSELATLTVALLKRMEAEESELYVLYRN